MIRGKGKFFKGKIEELLLIHCKSRNSIGPNQQTGFKHKKMSKVKIVNMAIIRMRDKTKMDQELLEEITDRNFYNTSIEAKADRMGYKRAKPTQNSIITYRLIKFYNMHLTTRMATA